MIKPNGWESGYSKIMLEWIETQWKLEKAHQAGEPYTRMKFEAECAKLENKLKDHISQAILSAEERGREGAFKEIFYIRSSYVYDDYSTLYQQSEKIWMEYSKVEGEFLKEKLSLSLPDQEQLTSKEKQDE